MNRDDFLKLVGAASGKVQYLPVACLLCNGYACAGYYHSAVNEDLTSTCVLLNAQLIELQGGNKVSGQPTINDFNDFLEEIVAEYCAPGGKGDATPRRDAYGKSILLTAVSYEQIAVVYPIAHIGELIQRAEKVQKELKQPTKRLPTFFDLDKSEFINLLRTKLW
jgi:hypothetical protein